MADSSALIQGEAEPSGDLAQACSLQGSVGPREVEDRRRTGVGAGLWGISRSQDGREECPGVSRDPTAAAWQCPPGASTWCRSDQDSPKPCPRPSSCSSHRLLLLGVALAEPQGTGTITCGPHVGTRPSCSPAEGLREHTPVRTGPAAQHGHQLRQVTGGRWLQGRARDPTPCTHFLIQECGI